MRNGTIGRYNGTTFFRQAMATIAGLAAMVDAETSARVDVLGHGKLPAIFPTQGGFSGGHWYRHRSGGQCGIRLMTDHESIPRRVREVRMAAEAKRKRKNAKRKLDFERAAIGKGPWV